MPLALVCLLAAASAGGPPPELVAATKQLLSELVAADTSNPPGNEARAVALGVKRLSAAGIPYEVTEFAPGRQNLVARLRGDGSARPLLLLSHVDVVGAEHQPWTSPPHQLTEVGPYLVARGVDDDLGMGAIDLELLIWLKQSGVRLRRDVIVAWTGDEESGGGGIRWLLANKPEQLDAEIALNEGGGPVLDEAGQVELVDLETAQKTYRDFTVSTTGPTGHASVPLGDNAIDRLARALDRLARHPFPPRLLPVTRAYFAGRAALEKGKVARALRELATAKGALPAAALAVVEGQPSLATLLHTTCVATLIHGGTRVNALPVTAEANLNCRILPDETPEQVQSALAAAIEDPAVKVSSGADFGSSGPSPLEGEAVTAIRRVSEELWPGKPVVPSLCAGADDSRFLRPRGVAAYGLLPFPRAEADDRRAHGVDERIRSDSLEIGLRYFKRLVLELAATPQQR